MSATVIEGLAYLMLASSSRDRPNTAWVAHVFASDVDNARLIAEIWPLAVQK